MKATANSIKLVGYGAFASFGTYFCMYAFRKPFTVATFENMVFMGVDYKIMLIIAQVLGYMLSKFIGIKLISELQNRQRLKYLIAMILLAEASLILFGWCAAPYNTMFMFTNGLSLGMIWGIVFSYLEGRKFTEILSMILCSSFIVSSGAVKSVGLLVMHQFKVSEIWMPAVTGAIFLIPFALFTILLEKIPPPTTEDIALKSKRLPMNKAARKKVFLTFLFPIIALVLFYISLTALRDFRDNFSREIWDAVGFKDNASVYILSEIPIAFCVLLILGCMSFVKNNKKAFFYYHYLLIFGAFVVGFGTALYQYSIIPPMLWMVLTGFGLYICYVPFNGIFFDRMIAAFRINGNAGFLIYIADAFGYLGSMAVLLYKNFGQGNLSWLHFFIKSTYIIAILGLLISILSLVYFKRKHKENLVEHQMTIV